MIETTTTDQPVATKRGRNRAVILTDRMCEKRVDERIKIYDRKCQGLFVSITAAGVATFFYKFTDKSIAKQRTAWLGVYNPETFKVEDARSAVYALKGKGSEAIVTNLRQQKVQRETQGKTVNELIKLRVAAMQELELKDDGELRPQVESWSNVASHFRRFVSPRLGKRIATEVSRDEIVQLSKDIVDGKYVLDGKPGKRSVSNARHMRRAVSRLYNWAAEEGYVPATCQPCLKLPKLKREKPCERVLDENEVRILWHGLDRDNMPWDRKTRLAIKFELVTMLRSAELLGARRDELIWNGDECILAVPLKRVKLRRDIMQPLSDLAVEIIKEAAEDGKQHIFASKLGDQPMERKAMATALRGTKYPNGKVKSRGICELLGLEPFTPHDLRRTAATLAGDLGFSDAWIAKCLDHQIVKDESGGRVPSVTGRVYNHSKRLQQKRAVLNGVAAELRRIVGDPAPAKEPQLRLAA
jgi:integrase